MKKKQNEFERVGLTDPILPLKSELSIIILKEMQRLDLSAKAAASLLDTIPMRIYYLKSGKIDKISLDALLKFVLKLGFQIEIIFKSNNKKNKTKPRSFKLKSTKK